MSEHSNITLPPSLFPSFPSLLPHLDHTQVPVHCNGFAYPEFDFIMGRGWDEAADAALEGGRKGGRTKGRSGGRVVECL